jgi:hypothetical protein
MAEAAPSRASNDVATTHERSTVEASMSAARKLAQKEREADVQALRVIFPSPLFKNRPVEFARDVLGIRSLAEHQKDIAIEFATNDNAAICGCTGQKMGKTENLVIAASHEFATERNVQVWVYGPKEEHTDKVFWPRFALYVINAYYPCKDCMPAHRAWCALVEVDPFDETPRPERCSNCSPLIPSVLKDPKDPSKGRTSEWLNPTKSTAGLAPGDGRVVCGYVARKEGGHGGFSGKLVMLGDEGSDIPDWVRETWEGNLVGGGKLLVFGNLLHIHGWFAQAFRKNSKESKRWTKLIQKSSRLSPNCPGTITWPDGKTTTNTTKDRPIRGMATRERIEKRIRTWSKNLICARIDAIPPEEVAGQLASMQLVSEAGKRWQDTRAEGRLQIGVDVARSRDGLAMAPRRGRKILEITCEVLGQDDHALGASKVAECARRHRKPHERKPLVVYDKSGKEGQDFGAELQKYASEIDIIGIVATHKPRDWKRFDRKRDELAFGFVEWLRLGALPPDAELEAEIDVTTSEAVEVSYGGSGMKWTVQRVIDNDDVRKILGRSPDRRNACELAVWDVDGSEVQAQPETPQPVTVSPPAAVAPAAPRKPQPRPANDTAENDAMPNIYERQAMVYGEMWGAS